MQNKQTWVARLALGAAVLAGAMGAAQAEGIYVGGGVGEVDRPGRPLDVGVAQALPGVVEREPRQGQVAHRHRGPPGGRRGLAVPGGHADLLDVASLGHRGHGVEGGPGGPARHPATGSVGSATCARP